MEPRPVDTRALLLGLLALMRKEGVAATRTRVVKFLYLADLQHARYAAGQTATGWTWRVDSFGPLAVEALHLLDQGVDEGWLRQWTTESDGSERDGARQAMGYTPVGETDQLLRGLPLGLTGQLRTWIKAHGSSTNRLLRFVYGDTEPMQTAREGDVLDFRTASKPVAEAPLLDPPISDKRRKRMNELMKQVRAQYDATCAASSRIADGPFDQEYQRGVPLEEGLSEAEVTISFPPPSDTEHGSS